MRSRREGLYSLGAHVSWKESGINRGGGHAVQKLGAAARGYSFDNRTDVRKVNAIRKYPCRSFSQLQNQMEIGVTPLTHTRRVRDCVQARAKVQ